MKEKKRGNDHNHTFFRPVYTFATASAMMLASVAELVKRILSTSKRARRAAASSPSSSFTAPKLTPLSSALRSAARITGCE